MMSKWQHSLCYIGPQEMFRYRFHDMKKAENLIKTINIFYVTFTGDAIVLEGLRTRLCSETQINTILFTFCMSLPNY
jgi:hypothetical protein